MKADLLSFTSSFYVAGVMYLHSRGICHRDLSLENILLCENYQKVIIPDFGLADDFPLIVNFPWNRGMYVKLKSPLISRGMP